MSTVTQLYIYPIKSVMGIPQHQAQVTFSGLLHDRRYMLIDMEGKFITARQFPALSLVHALPSTTDVLTLTHQQMPESLILRPSSFSDHYLSTQIWGDDVAGRWVDKHADEWFSQLLNTPVKLVFFGDKSARYTSRRPDQPVAFADGYPFLLTNEASLGELNRTALEQTDMRQFRPNIVVAADTPFIEDSWHRIRIGTVEFENVKPCVRCVFTTLNPQTAERSPTGEPLRTLAKFRRWEKKGVTFGINLVALNEGIIEQGDKVEVLTWREPEQYQDLR